MPPGPRLPRVVQTAGFMFGGARFLDACRRRYGDAVTFSTLFDERFVMVFDPELVKQVFQGSNGQLHAGEANALLGPIVGERSVLLLDGAEHLRHRKLMLPAFHGRQMLAHTETMRDCADLEIDAWPVGEPFTVLPTMQSLTLRVILRAVFGYEPGPEEAELRGRLRAMVEPLARPSGLADRLGAHPPAPRSDRRGAGLPGAPPGGRRDHPRRDRPPPPGSGARPARRRLLGAAAGARRGRRAPDRRRGPRRAPDAAARRPRDDRDRPGVDVRSAAP